MITVTENAIEQLRVLLAGGDRCFRLEINKGGCAGWQYGMKLDDARPGDTIIETPGGKLAVDSESAALLRDSVVDYSDSLNDSGFKIINPNAARSCGCGTSFEPAGSSDS